MPFFGSNWNECDREAEIYYYEIRNIIREYDQKPKPESFDIEYFRMKEVIDKIRKCTIVDII